MTEIVTRMAQAVKVIRPSSPSALVFFEVDIAVCANCGADYWQSVDL